MRIKLVKKFSSNIEISRFVLYLKAIKFMQEGDDLGVFTFKG